MSNDITHRACFDIPPPKSELQLLFEMMQDVNKYFVNPFTDMQDDSGEIKFICTTQPPLTIAKNHEQ